MRYPAPPPVLTGNSEQQRRTLWCRHVDSSEAGGQVESDYLGGTWGYLTAAYVGHVTHNPYN